MREYRKKTFFKDVGGHPFEGPGLVAKQKGEKAHIIQSDIICEANEIIGSQ